jgi:DNA-directed RNA polymerase subunit omega
MAQGRNTLMDPPIEDLLDKVDSKFTLVALGSARARQVNSYYNSLGEGLGKVVPPQVASVSGKPVSIAFEEIAAGKATYTRADPEADAAAADAAAEALAAEALAAEALAVEALAVEALAADALQDTVLTEVLNEFLADEEVEDAEEAAAVVEAEIELLGVLDEDPALDVLDEDPVLDVLDEDPVLDVLDEDPAVDDEDPAAS